MADANAAAETVRAALDLSVSASTTGFSVSLKIDSTILAGVLGVGALSLGAYYLANRRPVENAVRNGLESRNEAGVVDPEVRNIGEGSILVELHCHSVHSFMQFVEDFEGGKVKYRLEREFTKIGFQGQLSVTIENAGAVYKKVEGVRYGANVLVDSALSQNIMPQNILQCLPLEFSHVHTFCIYVIGFHKKRIRQRK